MKKMIFVLLAFILLIGFVATNSEAGTICWQMSPFVDIIKVNKTDTGGGGIKLLTGVWYATGQYYFPVVGTWLKDVNPANKKIGLHANVADVAQESCSIEIIIDKLTKEGPWQFSCNAGAATNSGTLVKIPCADAPAPVSPVAPDGPTAFGY